MKSNVTVRAAVSEDTAFIYKSLKEMALEQNLSARFSITQDDLFNALFSGKAFAEVMLAEVNQQPVGLALFSLTNRNFDLFEAPGIYVHDIYIQEPYRRTKIGTQLAEAIKNIAQERNCSRIDWVVLKNNQSAIEFYKKIPDTCAEIASFIYRFRLRRCAG